MPIKKKLRCITSFAIALIFSIIIFSNNIVFAAIHPDDTEAYALKEFEIIYGRSDGFALYDKPTRVEAAVILLRLIGKEAEALENNETQNFDDVPDWASAQIGYLYNKGIINGVSDSHFGNDPVDFSQMMTMILRVLGYNDASGDFVWNSAAEKAKELSILTPRHYIEISNSAGFTRKDMITCIISALQAPIKGENITLIRKLINQSVISEDQVKNTGLYDLIVAANLTKSTSQHYYLYQNFTVTPTSSNARVVLKVNLPDNYYNRQKVISHTFSIQPKSYYYDDGSLYAIFDISDFKEKTDIKIVTDLEIYKYDFETARALNFHMQLSEDDKIKYTSPTKWLESDNSTFKDIILNNSNENDILLVKEIMNFVIKHMRVNVTKGYVTALTAYNNGYGDCFDYSVVFAAICRAHGIPARVIIGDSTRISSVGHAIVEVFINDLGWVPFDPVNTDIGSVTFERLNNDFIYLSDNNNSDFLDGRNFYSGLVVNAKVDINEYFGNK